MGGVSFAAIDAGDKHTCGVTSTGAVYCWGDNTFGQLGDGTTTGRLVPTRVLQ
jgi:alpha-tubulin suppressor-like RCC1 family protein